jgi:hypothetical protein
MLQVSTDGGAVFLAPFAGGKTGLQRELRKLTNVSGGVKVKVKRGQAIVDVQAKVAVDESSLLKKNYVLVSLLDATHVATLVDAMEQECIALQGMLFVDICLSLQVFLLGSRQSFQLRAAVFHQHKCCQFSSCSSIKQHTS